MTTSNEDTAVALRTLRNQGMRARYDYVTIGHNWRMTDLAAAVAIPQMLRLDDIIAARNRNASRLMELLADSGIVLPLVPAGRAHVWHQFTVLLPLGCDRDAVITFMSAGGIATGAYYPRLVWDYAPYRDSPQVIPGDTPRARDMAARCLSLPVHPGLSEGDLERIASSLMNAVTSRAAAVR